MMSMNVNNFVAQADELFVLSDSFVRVNEFSDDEVSSINDIADVILLDPALTGAILTLANGRLAGTSRGKIDTVTKGIQVLGVRDVYTYVAGAFNESAASKIELHRGYLDSFWCKSVDCALMMKYLGAKLNIPNAERLFIVGLLYNMGELAVQQLLPEKIAAANAAPSLDLPWQRQEDVLGFTYGECGAALLKHWQLPINIIEPIANQDNNNFASTSLESKILYIAKRMMLSQYDCHSLNFEQLLPEEVIESMGIDQQFVSCAKNYCDFERLSILSILNPSAAMIY